MTEDGPPQEEPPIAVAGYRAEVADPEAVLDAFSRAREAWADSAPPDLRSPEGAILQVADAGAVCGPDHLRHAALRALAARRAGEGIADDPALDVLLYAAGVRQIREALETAGLREGAEGAAAVAVHPEADDLLADLAGELGWTRDDDVLAPSEAALDRLGIPASEREAVPRRRWPDLALERGALLEVDK